MTRFHLTPEPRLRLAFNDVENPLCATLHKYPVGMVVSIETWDDGPVLMQKVGEYVWIACEMPGSPEWYWRGLAWVSAGDVGFMVGVGFASGIAKVARFFESVLGELPPSADRLGYDA